MDNRLNTPWIALRLGIGLTATLAGIDKFFNVLADWGSYVSPLAAQLLPVSTGTFMGIVGIIEFAVGVTILAGWTRIGAYVASAWLLGVAANLVAVGLFDVALPHAGLAVAPFPPPRPAPGPGGAPAPPLY